MRAMKMQNSVIAVDDDPEPIFQHVPQNYPAHLTPNRCALYSLQKKKNQFLNLFIALLWFSPMSLGNKMASM